MGPVALVSDAVGDEIEDAAGTAYGWCGLCQSFTVFPHECAGTDRPAEEETT